MDLVLQIEDIIEKNGSDFELSKLFKAFIHEYKLSLNTLFKKNQGKDFLVRHTKQLDSIISLMYKTVLRRVFGNYLPMRTSIPIAIVALGSYGREQLCVHSDIDLLIVYEKVDGFNSELIIEKFFYLALDAGLKLGHRVHQVNDLFAASNEDITIRTSLMEARFVTGSNFTWHATTKELTKIRLHNQKEFILAKVEEAQIRRKKFPPSMQPNIKESVGGLRDSNFIFWIAQTIYGVTSLKDLTGTLYADDEYKEYRAALELLFRVRSALHLITNKQEDRLLLEHIPEVSRMLGFANEQKMVTKVLEAQWRISNFTQIFVKKMVRPYIIDMSNVGKFRHNRLSRGIYELNERIYASYNLPILQLNKLLEILVSLPDKFYHFDAGFLNQLTYTKISYPLQTKTYSLLKELFKKQHMYCFLKLFYDAGILHHLFHNFKKVLHLPQFDGYHHYPVDIHSIRCVEALENIEEPFIKKLYDEFSPDEKLLLKIVTLFHDTGKGRVQDHSEVGAKLIVPFVKKMKLKDEEIERCVTLVKQHVTMSNVAFKQNIHNEKTLYKFMSNVEDVTNLKLLYVLTYADINGVGDNVYTSFNSKLLRELYVNALEVAENFGRITDATKRINIEKRIQRHPEFIKLPKVIQSKLLRVESNLFFFKHTPLDTIEIAKKATQTKEYLYSIDTKSSLTIEIYRKIQLNIGYLLARLSHLDVASMEIFTLFDGVKYFKIEFIEHVEGDEAADIENIINNAFDMSKHVQLKEVNIHRHEIHIDCEHSLTHAEVNVNTQNQKGLLAYIMECFEELGINIVTAKIHSSKHKVRDSFLIEKQNDICNNVDKIFELLTKSTHNKGK
ncbi:MAG: phosphohydrolase [Sulfurimonas sp. RIFOXYD12_FULL_33_39]|uniref:[protein-PII] uridylyltransferase family protein n=1 Tax=unclassified Sulfurimonas TaxID=2623549 RepID=UPI0008C0C795|nr:MULTISPECIES: HD domain-containing protein [unclassified Sulfurimonas]OHE09127.1 MAG: phosphohydrolase [Sulfurimonas sp. RIFOXYD12_FULL_33_39]OHE14444.1 MAG: phosphohydrolase [Sulfurimonas sp. RIFOXYD2_FULL_34_21]DAB28476.1 MAG TPA: phosphohydrolase [Sulfurimonas sp. UBA10385]